jgi:hypothetical protein
MFASIRCYVVHKASTHELAGRVDAEFAELIGAARGFLSYEFLDCGGGETMTISVFSSASQAEDSRQLARRWSDEHLQDYEFTITEAVHGEICVRRTTDALLTATHPGSAGGYASVRRYRLATGCVSEVMRLADRSLADEIAQRPGFIEYCAIDCGDGDAISLSRFSDRIEAERSDELAAQFAGEQLGGFEIKRNEWIGGGSVLVSRATAHALEPAHA